MVAQHLRIATSGKETRMSETSEGRELMAKYLSEGKDYTRNLAPGSSVKYDVSNWAADQIVATWHYEASFDGGCDYFEAYRCQSFASREEAISYLLEHFDDPLNIIVKDGRFEAPE